MTVEGSEPLRSEQNGAATLRVLVADDRPDVLDALRLLLKCAGHKADTVDSPAALLRATERNAYDLILMDLNYTRDTTSGSEGLDLLAALHESENPAPVVVMTAWGNVDLAVEAMRRGAVDFVQKPWDSQRLLATIEKQAREGAIRRRARSFTRSELDIAHNVQQKLFPQKLDRLATLDYCGRCVPAHEVGGDYYDFLELAPGVIGFVLADVSGKGIAAALLMANLQGCFRSHAALALRSPRVLLSAVNRQFFESTPPEKYATLFFGVYDERSRELRYANCGHPAPMLLRNSGSTERLDPTGAVIGCFRDWDCQENIIRFTPGDVLVAFSDGVTEAGIESGEPFGEERLMEFLGTLARSSVTELVDSVIDTVHNATGGEQTDDITVVVLSARG